MSKTLQDQRIIRIETELGKDRILLHRLSGNDYISELFEYDLSLHSADHNISFDKIIGSKAQLTIRTEDDSVRFINGVISSFQHDGTFVFPEESEKLYSQYRATLVPWTWTLTLNTDCRIFQNKNVAEIAEQILSKHSLAIYRFELSKNYEPREFCVQYRESDFDFIARLFEEEGIFYFFEQTEQNEILVIADSNSQIKPSDFHANVNFAATVGSIDNQSVVSYFNFSQELKSSKYTIRDFDFRNPSLDLTANISGDQKRQFEVYDYPGEFSTHSDGDRIVRVRYEEKQAQIQRIVAKFTGRGLTAGTRFSLSNHPRKLFNREYLILKTEVSAEQPTYRASSSGNYSFKTTLRCIPFTTQFRPARKTRIPKILGTQTAIVVGPKGEEIHVDKHGRVKVHFHWDRVAKSSKSSCWIRVSQPWAGTGFGGITIPRIGQEVIVEFLEGDPDRPIITGRVYNGESRPPYELPSNKAHSGLISRSTPGGGSANFNGFRFNDESGGEKMEVQAEKDQQILVKNDNDKTVGNCETVQVGVDRTENVGNNETISIGSNRTETVGSNEKISIGSNRDEDVGSNETVKIGSNRNMTVGSNEVLSVGLTRTHSVGINEAINVGVAQEVSIGAVQIVSVGLTQLINVGLKQKVSAGKEIALKAPNILLEATESIQIKCGAGLIQIDAAGNITIKSPMVKINC